MDDPNLGEALEARGAPDTLLRTAYEVRDRAYADWRRVRESVTELEDRPAGRRPVPHRRARQGERSETGAANVPHRSATKPCDRRER